MENKDDDRREKADDENVEKSEAVAKGDRVQERDSGDNGERADVRDDVAKGGRAKEKEVVGKSDDADRIESGARNDQAEDNGRSGKRGKGDRRDRVSGSNRSEGKGRGGRGSRRGRNNRSDRGEKRDSGQKQENADNAERDRFDGILELIGDKKFGFIRVLRPEVPKGDKDAFVPPPLIRKYKLRDGLLMEGTLRPGKKGDMQVNRIDKVMGVDPAEWAKFDNFDSGQIIYPDEKLELVTGPKDISMRVVDLAAPIGKGQRALIVAPPRTGKTILLKNIAASVTTNHPEIELVALLVDERPEEVTDFRRSTSAMVFASSNDQDEDNHVRVSTLALEYAKRLVEMKKDVVLLLDSLTRLGRTFNLYSGGSGRTMSGGLDAGAMKIPRRIFGAARNIEGGGSLTIIATALIETGSRMDEVIFEEFKGTGNSEIVLDREMANKRIFPAINLRKSGTRNEEKLLGDKLEQHHRLFRALNSRSPIEAMQALLRHLQQTPTNEYLLDELIST